jgi:hypothetical protein
MGARTVFSFETEPGEYIHLYSHWGGDTKMEDLAYALEKARPRWGDESYALRIMISELIGVSWDKETGYGLWTQHHFEEEYDETEIDIRNKTVFVKTTMFSFDEFIDEFGGGR